MVLIIKINKTDTKTDNKNSNKSDNGLIEMCIRDRGGSRQKLYTSLDNQSIKDFE